MGKGNIREPIGFTCPQINKTQELIQKVSDGILEFLSVNEDLGDGILDELSLLVPICDKIRRGYLEKLRESNDTLRAWGNEEAVKAEDLEKDLNYLRRERDDFVEQIRSLEFQVENLESQIQKLEIS